jgi:hypothetical protein
MAYVRENKTEVDPIKIEDKEIELPPLHHKNEIIIRKGDIYEWELINGTKYRGEIVEMDSNVVHVKLPSGEMKAAEFFSSNWKSKPGNTGERLVKIINSK